MMPKSYISRPDLQLELIILPPVQSASIPMSLSFVASADNYRIPKAETWRSILVFLLPHIHIQSVTKFKSL